MMFRSHPLQIDLFDGESLRQALAGCEAILHLATRIPPTMKMAKRSAWQENDRIRREGTRTLVEAALAGGSVQTFIYPSFAFVYPDSGDRWIDADTTPVQPAVTLHSTLDAEADVARFAGNERRGISLRMGGFYGPESPATWEFLRYARMGIAAFPGSRDAYLPHIWVQDAASAIVTALTQPVPSGVYDMVDDEPLTRGELFDAIAQAVGRKHLLPLPDLLMRMLTGVKYDDIHRSLRIANHRFKEVSSWQPKPPRSAGLATGYRSSTYHSFASSSVLLLWSERGLTQRRCPESLFSAMCASLIHSILFIVDLLRISWSIIGRFTSCTPTYSSRPKRG